jgi:membrane protease YdiL (CAAX protease family)
MDPMATLFSRFQAVIWAGILSSIIVVTGAGIWTALLTSNLKTTPTIPWSAPVMALILLLIWQYLGGKGWPQRSTEARRAYLRAYPVSRVILFWAWLAGVLAIVALAGLWIVLVELTKVGGNPTLPNYSAYPLLTLILGILMGSLVSPITEEAAFRGYSQVILERKFPRWIAIVISSLFFAFWHGPTQGFLWPKLLFYFLVGVIFGAIAYITGSVLPAIPVHILGDLTFFFLIWPYDATRPFVWQSGTNIWFWLFFGQTIAFSILSILAFGRLAMATQKGASKDASVT